MLAGIRGITYMVKSKKKRKKVHIPLPEWLQPYVDDAKEWCRGRNWCPRLLLLIFFAYITVSHMRDPLCSDIFKGLNLAIHEMGHPIFHTFGEFPGVAGGSIFQCLVPLLSIIMFLRQRDYFAIAVCFGWLSTNLFDVATYAADARALQLPLVSPYGGGEEIIHDWNYILDKLNMLQYDYIVAGWLRFFAVVSTLICLGVGSWLIYNMGTLKKQEQAPDLLES